MSTRLGACSDRIRGATVPPEGTHLLHPTPPHLTPEDLYKKQTNKPRSHTSCSSPGLRPTITQAHPCPPQQGESIGPPHRTPQHPKKKINNLRTHRRSQSNQPGTSTCTNPPILWHAQGNPDPPGKGRAPPRGARQRPDPRAQAQHHPPCQSGPATRHRASSHHPRAPK